MSKVKLQEILTRRLRLKSPRFELRNYGGHLCGSIISPTFKSMDDLKRIRSIRGALEAELGGEAADKIGMLLAFTPYEWEEPRIEDGPGSRRAMRARSGRNGHTTTRRRALAR